MLKNYMITAFRYLWRNKFASIISIVSLIVGITFVLMISIWIDNQFSYDDFQSQKNTIVKLDLDGTFNGKKIKSELAPIFAASVLKDELPEVIDSLRILPMTESITIRNNNLVFRETKSLLVDPNYFEFFDIPLRSSDKTKVLSDPKGIVINKKMSEKYFQGTDALNKTIIYDDVDYRIKGVADFTGFNTHIYFNFLRRLPTFTFSNNNIKNLHISYITYLKIIENTNLERLRKKVENIVVNKYLIPTLKMAGIEGTNIKIDLVPLKDIYLHSPPDSVLAATMRGNIDYIYILMLVSLCIITIASLNYANIALTRGLLRSNEISIRKVNGADKIQIRNQFIIESIIHITIAMVLSLIMVFFLKPIFQNMTGVEISTRQVLSPSFGIIIVLTMIFISIVSGIYPSVLFAKKAPIVLMKSSFEGWGSKSTLRKLFIILQYSISVILMIMVFFIIYQLQFVKNKDLNIQQKNKLVINIDNTDYDNNPWPLKNHLLKLPQVKSVSVSHVVPWIWRGASFYKTENENNSSILWPYYCDYDFFKTYGIKVIKGRVFNELNSTDIDTCILNEKAVDILGLQEPLDAILKTRVSPENAPEAFRKLKVIGVIKDFNNQSLHEEIRPMIIQLMRPGVYPNYVSVDLRPGNTDKAISEIEKVFSNLIKGQPFEYFLLEDFFNNFYLSEDKFFNIFMIGSITAILLSCFGLFGLAAFILQQRTKEVGIRKVLGATSLSITLLLTKRFILWLIIANVIAWPIAFIYVNDWLSNFVYRVNMDIRLFILAGIISVFAAFSAIITHTIKVATSNPVKLLRYE